MANPFLPVIRILGFCRKELIEVSRRPGVLTILLLAPVVITLLIGLGFRSSTRLCRTVFIARQQEPLSAQIYRYAPSMDPGIAFLGIFENLPAAKQKLQLNELDLVVIVPENAAELISNNEQAQFTLLHNAMNPSESEWIRSKGEMLVDGLNQWLLNQAVKSGREQLQADVKECIQDANRIRKALEHADLLLARELELDLSTKMGGISRAVRSRVEALDMPPGDQLRELLSNLVSIRSQIESPLVPEAQKRNYSEEIENAIQLENDLIVLSAQLSQIEVIDAHLLLAPFSSRVETIRPAQPDLKDYYSPVAIVILLQHVAATFCALSLLREFRAGRRDLFRAAPLSRHELLLGKYLGYLLLCGLIACMLTGILVYVLRVPMMGNWIQYSSAVGALLFTSLGAGFIISGVSSSEEQAVLYSMLLFILSVFFAGVLLNLDMLWTPVRILSWSLPATYGIQLIRDVMLRGNAVDPLQLGILAGLGVTFYIVAALMCGKKLART